MEVAAALILALSNVFIGLAVRYFTGDGKKCDMDGAIGANGKVDQGVLDGVLQSSYFFHDIPKTTERETFGDRTAEDICEKILSKRATTEDCVATIVRLQPSPCSKVTGTTAQAAR